MWPRILLIITNPTTDWRLLINYNYYKVGLNWLISKYPYDGDVIYVVLCAQDKQHDQVLFVYNGTQLPTVRVDIFPFSHSLYVHSIDVELNNYNFICAVEESTLLKLCIFVWYGFNSVSRCAEISHAHTFNSHMITYFESYDRFTKGTWHDQNW